eukprot:8859741-Alexandrium_andersonii.AAC.1
MPARTPPSSSTASTGACIPARTPPVPMDVRRAVGGAFAARKISPVADTSCGRNAGCTQGRPLPRQCSKARSAWQSACI